MRKSVYGRKRGAVVCVCERATRTWLTHTRATVILLFWRKRYFIVYDSFANGFWQNNYNVYSGGRIAVHVFRCVGNKSVNAKRVQIEQNNCPLDPARPRRRFSTARTIYAPRNGCQKIVRDRVFRTIDGRFENPLGFCGVRVFLCAYNNRSKTLRVHSK